MCKVTTKNVKTRQNDNFCSTVFGSRQFFVHSVQKQCMYCPFLACTGTLHDKSVHHHAGFCNSSYNGWSVEASGVNNLVHWGLVLLRQWWVRPSENLSVGLMCFLLNLMALLQCHVVDLKFCCLVTPSQRSWEVQNLMDSYIQSHYGLKPEKFYSNPSTTF